MADLYREQGKYAEAEPLYQKALRIRNALESQHPEATETMHGLAQLRETQGNREEARTWYTQALAIREQVLGKHHLKTTQTRSSLTGLLRAMGQYDEATQLEGVHPEEERREKE